MPEITVIEWGEYSPDYELGDERRIGWLGGFFEDGMRWKDYLEQFDEWVHPYLEAARQWVLKYKVRRGGSWHQDQGELKFSDGKVMIMSMRAWGDQMAAIWAEEEDKDYSYITFYIGEHGDSDELPEGGTICTPK